MAPSTHSSSCIVHSIHPIARETQVMSPPLKTSNTTTLNGNLVPLNTEIRVSSPTELYENTPVTPSPMNFPAAMGGKLRPAFSPREPSEKVAESENHKMKSESQDQWVPNTESSSINSTAIVPSNKRYASSSKSSSPKPVKVNTGRWTDAEHKQFLRGLETFPYRAWKKIATLIKTRTVVQIRTHAQKYYQKLQKESARIRDREHQLAQATSHNSGSSSPNAPSTPMSCSSNSESDIEPTSPRLQSSRSLDMKASSLNRKHMIRRRRSSPDDFTTYSSESPRSTVEHNGPTRTTPSKHKSEESEYASDSSMSTDTIMEQAQASHDLMIEDLQEERTSHHTYLPMTMEGTNTLDVTMSSLDSDDLLQLTDDENLDWFATGTDNQSLPMGLMKSNNTNLPNSSAINPFNGTTESTVDSDNFAAFPPSSFGLNDLNDTDVTMDSSFFSLDDQFALDDEDFVLDPEKFLLSYFNPTVPMCPS